MSDLSGSWKRDGFVVSVPVALRADIQVVRVQGARVRPLGFDPKLCYIIIPNDAPAPDQWRVYLQDGALCITSPQARPSGGVVNIASGNARVGMQIGSVGTVIGAGGKHAWVPALPEVGVMLPRQIPVLHQV